MKGKALLALIPLGGIAASAVLPLFLGSLGASNPNDLSAGSGCTVALDPPPAPLNTKGVSVGSLNAEQMKNAATIYQVAHAVFNKDGKARATRAAIIGIATARQESSLTNIQYGDQAGPDSRGLFQQRDPWGPLADRMNPAKAAKMFFTGGQTGQHGLDDIGPWWTMPIWLAAQTVQVSAFPTAYAQWEQLATDVVAKLDGTSAGSGGSSGGSSQGSPGGSDPCGGQGGDPGTAVPVSGDVGKMLGFAKTLLGTPYVWGGTTYPPGVDCSGLVVYAWNKAGHPVRIRTSQQMYGESVELTPGKEQPGDLVFSEFDSSGPGHVMIVWDPKAGTVIEAPHTGDVVKFLNYKTLPGIKFGRLKPSAFAR